MARLLEILPKEASKLGRLAYVEGMYGMSIGAVAGLLVDAMNVDVGICYKVREKGWVNLSIRGRRGFEIHLREATKRLAKRWRLWRRTQEGGRGKYSKKRLHSVH
jgi:hypothetical protein